MPILSTALRERPVLKAALFVPSVIALIFSLFNLSVAPDPAALAAQATIATVNEDAGLPFPPVNMAGRMIEGLGQRLPMHLQAYASEAEARAALDAEEVAAMIVFPADFSTAIAGQGPVPLTVVTSGSLTMGEAQLTGALPSMLESGVAAAVQSIRLGMAQGRMPDLTPPVALQTEVLHAPANAASRMAPFIANFVTALSALVGGIIGWVGTRGFGGARGAALRTIVPMIALPLAAGVLAVIVASLAGGNFVTLWLGAAALGIALGWFFAGSLALFGPIALAVLVPLVFWQSALGGAQMPLAAGPAWLQGASVLGLDQIGGYFRAVILGGSGAFPVALAGLAAAAGLAMIWLRGALVRTPTPVTA